MTRPDPVAESLAAQRDRLTVDDLRHKALAVRDQVKDETTRVLDQPTSRYVIAGIVVIGVSMSVAYLMGTLAKRKQPATQPCRCYPTSE